MNSTTKAKGFTIIEVVLVLAIAALIFLMIFVAYPALQRSQRDTARKDEVGAIGAAVARYKSDYQGALPSIGDINGTSSLSPYIDTLNLLDKTTSRVSNAAAIVSETFPLVENRAIVFRNSTCSGNLPVADASVNNRVAVVISLEAGGTPISYCKAF